MDVMDLVYTSCRAVLGVSRDVLHFTDEIDKINENSSYSSTTVNWLERLRRGEEGDSVVTLQ